jgi:hypothetical protein
MIYSTLTVFCCVPSGYAQQRSSGAGEPPPAKITGSGTTGYIPLWTNAGTLGNSAIFQTSSGQVGIGTATPAVAMDVNGAVNASAGFSLGGSPFAFGSLVNHNAFLGFSGNSTTTGTINTALGVDALETNTSGYENEAIGYGALRLNTSGYLNNAVGVGALQANTTGSQNSATGGEALQSNTTGSLNTATGAATLPANTTGSNNTAEGWSALKQNTTGDDNTAAGYGSIAFNTTGGGNTASGMLSLYYNITGSNNTALGYSAGPDIKSTNLSFSTAIGAGAIVSQSNALVLGGPLGGGAAVNVGIGTATPSHVFTIAQGAGPAFADGWSVYSSRRWKTNIQTIQSALEKVEQLRGVSYDLTATGKHEVGVIAEEVGAVVPEVVTWDRKGENAEGVDYSRLTALLIEAAKEQQAIIREQQKQIGRLSSKVTLIQAALEGTGGADAPVQKVSASLRTVEQ